MDYVNFIFFLLSFVGGIAQNVPLEKRLYYQDIDSTYTYGAGAYTMKVKTIKSTEKITPEGMKKFAQNFAYYNDFPDSIPKVNPRIKYPHYYVGAHEERFKDYWQNNFCYFLYDMKGTKEPNMLIIVQSVSAEKSDAIDMEMFNALISGKYQKTLEKNALGGREFDFLGRKISLDSECYWVGINIVRCPNLGEMNWSLHRTLAEAKAAVDLQTKLGQIIEGPIPEENTTYQRIGDREIELIFEGKRTKALEISYNMHYQHPIIKSYSYDKQLTVYYIAATVRGNHIACVLSYWNDNPKLPDTELPAFISEFVRLK